MDINVKNYVITNEEMIQLEKQLQKIKQVQEQLEQYFDFEIPKYIAVDIAENETYNHICSMINLATVNERISRENAATLKQELKQLLDIINDNNVESIIIK